MIVDKIISILKAYTGSYTKSTEMTKFKVLYILERYH